MIAAFGLLVWSFGLASCSQKSASLADAEGMEQQENLYLTKEITREILDELEDRPVVVKSPYHPGY